MGELFTIDAATKGTITSALDDIITEFGKRCRLVYPARWTPCDNCLQDPVSRKSNNRWRSGGPVPFRMGVCPACSGEGGHAEESSEEVVMKVEWSAKKFWVPVPSLDIRVPYSVCQTKYLITLNKKVARCDHMVVQLPIEHAIPTRFKLFGSPTSPGNIIQDRYCVATWESKG